MFLKIEFLLLNRLACGSDFHTPSTSVELA